MQNPRLVTSISPKLDHAPQLTGEKPSRLSSSSIGAEVTIVGNIEAAADLHIEGSVVGEVRCQTLYLGESSKISGSIQAARVRIAGTVEGQIKAHDLAVEATARVKSKVSYSRLRVANGASIQGSLKYERPAELRTDEKIIAPITEPKPSASAVPAKTVPESQSPLARRHHRPRGRVEPPLGQGDLIQRG